MILLSAKFISELSSFDSTRVGSNDPPELMDISEFSSSKYNVFWSTSSSRSLLCKICPMFSNWKTHSLMHLINSTIQWLSIGWYVLSVVRPPGTAPTATLCTSSPWRALIIKPPLCPYVLNSQHLHLSSYPKSLCPEGFSKWKHPCLSLAPSSTTLSPS